MTAVSTSPGGAVLIVYPFCLDHVGHGNIQRILAIARYLAAQGFLIDLVYQASPRVPRVDAQDAAFRRVFAVEGGASSSEAAACAARLRVFYSGHEPPPAHMRPSAPLTTLVRGILDAEPYRAVVATYAFTAPIFAGLRRTVLTVCDVQDVMHEHAEACERATGHASSFTMPAATEAFLWRQWDALVAITPEDHARIARDVQPGQHLLSARHAAAGATAAAPGVDDVALYAASDNQSNVQAATWLLERVWPLVRAARPSARLRMAGLICAAVPAHLRQAPGLELLGFCDDIGGEVAGCGVVVAPYLYGSGLKIKVVEAACAGKAVVTTTAGVTGTGLGAGRALEVHDEVAPFAAALARLLGDGAERLALAERARVDAGALFSAEACYESIAVLIRLYGTAASAMGGPVWAVDAMAIDRLRLAFDEARPGRVVVWGNGAYTRQLLAAWSESGLAADLIVDGRGTGPATSPEGLPVVPKTAFASRPDDLVVLSSETFEHDMWRDLAAYRQAGGLVLGLCDSRLVSRGLLERLSPTLRATLGAPHAATRAAGRRVAAFWDSGAGVSRWWRMRRLCDLAAGAAGRGYTPVVACRAALAARPDVLESCGAGVEVLPVVECAGEEVESRDLEGGVGGLVRAAALAATNGANALGYLRLAASDLLIVIEPSLSECLGLARVLAAAALPDVPTVALWLTAPERSALQLPPAALQAYWRLALGALADAAGARLVVVTPDQTDTARLGDYLQHPVQAVGHPRAHTASIPGPAVARVLCLGHVTSPGVRPMLETVAAAARGGQLDGASVSWRSDQHETAPSAADWWAAALASLLQVQLLDDVTPAAMANAVAHADVVAILSGDGTPWDGPVRALANAADVPVVTPTTADDIVVLLAEAIGRRRRTTNDAPSGTAFDRLLAALPSALSSTLSLASLHPVPRPAPFTEICQ